MFNKKEDPLVGVISGIVDNTARMKEVEKQVNETFGIQSRKSLPHERVAEYEAALNEAKTKALNEGLGTNKAERAINRDDPDLKAKAKKLAKKKRKSWEELWGPIKRPGDKK